MLPTVDFFGEKVTRLILGDNPVHGYSYIDHTVPGEAMLDYYTAQNTMKLYDAARDAGINTLLALANEFNFRVWRQYVNEGGDMRLMYQSCAALDLDANLRDMRRWNPLAIYHQGGTADDMVESGQTARLRDRIRRIKDAGVPAGLGTHMPETVLRAEDEDWGVDFYMTCLYNARRQHRLGKTGFMPDGAEGLVFYPEDKYIMFDVIRQVKKPCLAFKLLAGGQVFYGRPREEYPAIVEREFRDAYQNIKPGDMCVIGAFQRDGDQIGQDARIAARVLNAL